MALQPGQMFGIVEDLVDRDNERARELRDPPPKRHESKAGSGVTGGVAANFSFTDSELRNYDESFMVDADPSKIRRLVLSAQDNMKKAIFASPPTSYFSAESIIIRYAGLCSFLGMQDLLNESVSEKTARIEAATSNTTDTITSGTSDAPAKTETVTTEITKAGVETPQTTRKTTTTTTGPMISDAQAAAAATEVSPGRSAAAAQSRIGCSSVGH